MRAIRPEAPTRVNALVAVAATTFMFAPMAIVVAMSFSSAESFQFPPPGYSTRHYATYFQSDQWLRPTFNSLFIGVVSSILTLLVATPAAFALSRREFRGRRVLQVIMLLPMLVPSIILAISYYTLFGKIGLNQTFTGVILAHTCLSLPVVLIAMSSSLRALDRNVEWAAVICGATPVQTFTMVIFPVLRPAFLISGFFAFIHSFDEATISIFISSREVSTLPRRMFTSIQLEADPVVPVVASLIILAALLIMAVGIILRTRRARLVAGGS